MVRAGTSHIRSPIDNMSTQQPATSCAVTPSIPALSSAPLDHYATPGHRFTSYRFRAIRWRVDLQPSVIGVNSPAAFWEQHSGVGNADVRPYRNSAAMARVGGQRINAFSGQVLLRP